MKNASLLKILLFLLGFFSFVFSQNPNQFDEPKGLIEYTTPFLPHASNTIDKEGFSVYFTYPGFFSYIGQLNVCYTSECGDMFYGGIGVYVMGGVNKRLASFKTSRIYLNVNIGTIFDQGTLGSFGFSYIAAIKNKTNLEICADIYYNHGLSFDGPPSIPYSIGSSLNIVLSKEIINNFLISAGIGLSYIQYRYTEINTYHYEYIYKKIENEYPKESLGWDKRLIIPLGFSLSYHF